MKREREKTLSSFLTEREREKTQNDDTKRKR